MIFLLALIFIYTPGILMWKDGVRDDVDVIQWMMNQNLQFILFLDLTIKMGVNILGLSVVLQALEFIRKTL